MAFTQTRRRVIGGIGATVVLPLFGTAARAVTVNKRRNIETLSAADLNTYKKAIQTLKDRSAANPDDPTGYSYWAGLHDDFETPHSGCDHASEQFFPWHRRYLYDFEQLLQKIDAGIMIPYWDWTKVPTTGKKFPGVFEDAASPLYDRTRKSVTPPPWDPVDLRKMVQDGSWTVFAGPAASQGGGFGTVEGSPHNTLHGNISRNMSNPTTAANDPIFWSFHAFIDVTWSRWQRLHVSATSPQPFQDPNADLWYRDRSYKVGSTASTSDYGYEYDYDFSPDGPPASTMVAAARMRAPLAEGGPTQALALRRDKSGSVSGNAKAGSVTSAATVLRLTGVKAFHDRTYELAIYIHPKNVDIGTLKTGARKQYLVRTITIWQQHHDLVTSAFVRPSEEQIAKLNKGWVVTMMSEVAPSEAPAGGAMAMSRHAPKLATHDVVQGISLEER